MTGVQTCALPISDEFFIKMSAMEGVRLPGERRHKNRLDKGPRNRSEERRVGKECRSGWEQTSKKTKTRENNFE